MKQSKRRIPVEFDCCKPPSGSVGRTDEVSVESNDDVESDNDVEYDDESDDDDVDYDESNSPYTLFYGEY